MEKSFSTSHLKSDLGTYENVRKILTDLSDDYITVSLLNYSYFKITLQDDSNR